jgi:hypothetical protein
MRIAILALFVFVGSMSLTTIECSNRRVPPPGDTMMVPAALNLQKFENIQLNSVNIALIEQSLDKNAIQKD